MSYSVKSPAMVMRPILFASDWVNPSPPVRPAAMRAGAAPPVGTRYSVISPAIVMRPIRFALSEANHIAPSGPAAMPSGYRPGARRS